MLTLPDTYLRRSDEHRYQFGPWWISFEDANSHSAFVASTGGGKSVNIRIMLGSVVRQVVEGTARGGCRAVLYDSKTEAVSHLASQVERDLRERRGGRKVETHEVLSRVIIANPFDARCGAWDIARDINDPAVADDVAALMIPIRDTSGGNDFFPKAARRLLEAAMTVFIKRAPGRWRLRDLVAVAQRAELLEAVLDSLPETAHLTTYFYKQKSFGDVVQTLQADVLSFSTIAAAWERAGYRWSIGDFLRSEQILVLGNSTRKKEPIMRVNQLIFDELVKVLLDEPGEHNAGQNWFFLDELPELGRMMTLSDLMSRGRSKGAAVVLGLTDIGKLDAVYGREQSHSIVGSCNNVCFGHIHDTEVETQRWASGVVGDKQHKQIIANTSGGTSRNPGPQGTYTSTSTNHGTSEQYVTEPAMLASQFGSNDPRTGLPKPKRGTDIQGLYRVNGMWKRKKLFGRDLYESPASHVYVNASKSESYTDIQPWDVPLELKPWSTVDAERLNLPRLAELLRREAVKTDDPDNDDSVRRVRDEITRA